MNERYLFILSTECGVQLLEVGWGFAISLHAQAKKNALVNSRTLAAGVSSLWQCHVARSEEAHLWGDKHVTMRFVPLVVL